MNGQYHFSYETLWKLSKPKLDTGTEWNAASAVDVTAALFSQGCGHA